MRYLKLTFGLAALGAVLGLVLATMAGSSDPYVSDGDVAAIVAMAGFVLGGAVGLVGSLVWALSRWLARNGQGARAS